MERRERYFDDGYLWCSNSLHYAWSIVLSSQWMNARTEEEQVQWLGRNIPLYISHHLFLCLTSEEHWKLKEQVGEGPIASLDSAISLPISKCCEIMLDKESLMASPGGALPPPPTSPYMGNVRGGRSFLPLVSHRAVPESPRFPHYLACKTEYSRLSRRRLPQC